MGRRRLGREAPPRPQHRGEVPDRAIHAPVDLALELGWVGTGVDRGSDAPPRQASPRRTLERYFHAVVTAVEQMASEPSPSREGHLRRLEEIYRSLLGPAVASRGRCSGKRPTDGRGQLGLSRAP